MECPYCHKVGSRVLDSRESSVGIRRRRLCEKCQKRFTTYEKVSIVPVMVLKRDGRREIFSNEKLESAIKMACVKRPITDVEITNIVEKIEILINKNYQNEIKAGKIGQMCIKYLKKLDHVAYIRFASVYRDFKNIDSFTKEVELLKR
ncbi:MAG: transcriptional regulator NrdR [Chloroflexi bacterium]|nr:transcriptional regulator NrdR [Chloroflexota bacterium]